VSARFLVFAIVTISLAGGSIAAQQGTSTPPVRRLGGNIRANPVEGPLPRRADGKPDLSGVWLGGPPVVDISTALPKGETMPLLPETRKRMQSQLAKDDPQANCLPLPPPRATPYPWRIVVTPTHAFFLYEMYNYRQVFMDGRKHPPLDELDPTWYGHSIGWWEGDTLVVDTIGFNDKSWFDNIGHPHSDKLHVVERYTRTSLGEMAGVFTIDDPGAYSRPFTVSFTARLMPKDELMEYVCNENNQDVPGLVGPADTRGR
jgi:hypothetical protein